MDLMTWVVGWAVVTTAVVILACLRLTFGLHETLGDLRVHTVQTLADHMAPALKQHFYPLERSGDVFSWDPI